MDELSHLPCFPSQAVPDHMSEFEEVLLQAFKDAYASEHAEHKAIAAYLTMFKVRAKQNACRPSRHEGGHCISGFEAAWVHTGNVALACVLVHVLVLMQIIGEEYTTRFMAASRRRFIDVEVKRAKDQVRACELCSGF